MLQVINAVATQTATLKIKQGDMCSAHNVHCSQILAAQPRRAWACSLSRWCSTNFRGGAALPDWRLLAARRTTGWLRDHRRQRCHHWMPLVMLPVGPLAVVAVLSGNRTLLKASAMETDAHTDSSADTRACTGATCNIQRSASTLHSLQATSCASGFPPRHWDTKTHVFCHCCHWQEALH
jgi:hypothetical protein